MATRQSIKSRPAPKTPTSPKANRSPDSVLEAKKKPNAAALKEEEGTSLAQAPAKVSGDNLDGSERQASPTFPFTDSGMAANVALAETALLENRDDSLLIETINELDASAMYKILIDEQYENQDDNRMDDLVNTTNYSILALHARLYLAGRIAERADRRRRRRQAKVAAHVLRVRLGEEALPNTLKERLP